MVFVDAIEQGSVCDQPFVTLVMRILEMEHKLSVCVDVAIEQSFKLSVLILVQVALVIRIARSDHQTQMWV